MMRAVVRHSRVIILLIYSLLASICLAGDNSVPPNFLFILVDDLGYMDIGANNPETFYETPNIDSLANQGMRFTRAYAAAPACSPTRASIMSGKTPASVGITDYIDNDRNNQPEKWQRNTKLIPSSYMDRLTHDITTFPKHLQAAGYKTFFAGKWHLGPEGFWPQDHGFDINKGGNELGAPWTGNQYFSPYDNPSLEDGPVGEHLPDRLASETIGFIKDNQYQPFLAFLSFYSVHTPLIARQDLKNKYQEKRKEIPQELWGKEGDHKVRLVQNDPVYAAMVEAMDLAVGRVLDELDRLALDRNTVVIFTSDNGGLSTSEGYPTSNFPLRAGKGWLYEGGIREPMIVKWPGVTMPNSITNEKVISMDFFPTILEMAGIERAALDGVDGSSFVPVLKGESPQPRQALHWHYPHYGNQGGSPSAAIMIDNWKLIEFFEDKRFELYNLRDDISEQLNLASVFPDKTRELSERLHAWQKGVDAKLPSRQPFSTRIAFWLMALSALALLVAVFIGLPLLAYRMLVGKFNKKIVVALE